MEERQKPLYEILPARPGEVCEADSTPFHSPGFWNVPNGKSVIDFALPRLQLQIAVMFILSQSLHMLLKRFQLPRLVSEISAGIILGPTILGSLFPNMSRTLFPAEGDLLIQLLSTIGFMFFMFLIGVKMNPTLIVKSGRKAWTIAVFSTIILILIGLTASEFVGRIVPPSKYPAIKFTIGTYTLTPFPVIACLLVDLKIINTELGRLAMATTLIRELINTIAATVINYMRIANQTSSILVAIKSVFCCLCLVTLIVVGGRPFFLWIIRQTPEGKQVRGVYITFISFGVLLSAILSDNVGIDYSFGPFILGLTIPDGPPLGSTLVDRLETFTSGLLTPMLVTLCGLKTNLGVIYNIGFFEILVIVVILGVAIKFAAILLPSFHCKLPLKDAVALSLIMSTQGVVEMARYHSSRQNELFDGEVFSWMTFAVLLSALTMPLLVRSIYDTSRTYAGYQKRNILHSSENDELRILACAHRQDDALAAIKLLEASAPTKETPTSIYALVLVELVGRASPLLINHRFGQKTSVAGARSQHIIDVFNQYEQEYVGFAKNVQAFTAISIPKFMHHDICSLAFDRLASLIILPFHRKWNSQGKMFVSNDIVRTINQNVLEMAPCSVGILIDRRKIKNTATSSRSNLSVYRVAVVFIGGEDDREALAYAKRTAKSLRVHLTVVRLIAILEESEEETGEDNWRTMLDTEVLKEIRLLCSLQSNIVYREERLKDGPETASIIHSMEDGYDLIIVGRRHSLDSPIMSGLKEWTELPELGVIGDILASPDIDKPVSVLVIQQQHMS